MTRQPLYLLLCLLPLAVGPAQDKTLILKKVPHSPDIDGLIDSMWSQADSATGFFQTQPYYAQQPSRNTVAKVLTTDEALYCVIICYDDQHNIQKTTGKLDDFAGDIVSIMFDTFGDRKTAYKFAVTASGVKADSRLLDDARNRDYGWDGVWFAKSRIYEWGFVVEMEIPYRSIQYDETLTEWGLDFDRWIPHLQEDLYWCRYEQNEGQRVSKFGRLVFQDFRPSVKGENLEIYPVGLTSANYAETKDFRVQGDVGLDVFYNPSPALTFQLTANPDFAQIEADPFSFNISRYETYYNERRPFFTQGNEIFMPSGRERNTGFYRPLELLYTRRIGRKLQDGSEVPLYLGTKAFGRAGDWEYGGFLSMTGSKDFDAGGTVLNDPQAYFASARVKKHILDNSAIGILYVGKFTRGNTYGVIDIDGAFRTSGWQLSYQIARSIKNNDGDFGGSAGFVMLGEKWLTLARTRIIGEKFDIDEVGFVPWKGTAELTALTGPRWYYEDGYISQILAYAGGSLYNEKVDGYTDQSAILGYNMQFRTNWGFEINLSMGQSRDQGVTYRSYEGSWSSWFHPSPDFNGSFWGGYSRSYNFRRNYLAYYGWSGIDFGVQMLKTLQAGTSLSANLEFKPDRSLEDVVLNSRPYLSLTPVNDLNIRLYLDVLYFKSTDHLEQTIFGLLFSYNFLPKSWIYLAVNEFRDRRSEYDALGSIRPNRLHVTDRAGVLKLKYLYYF